MRTFDKKFIEFPLSCLIYFRNDVSKLKELIQFYLIETALKLGPDDCEVYQVMIANIDIKNLPNDFNQFNSLHLRILSACLKTEIFITRIDESISSWYSIKEFIQANEFKNGKDPYCRIGVELIIDVINGGFSKREFLIFCAIQSVIGKKKLYSRITYDRISYRMLGYKKKSIAIEEGNHCNKLSNRQIAISVIKLRDKKLLTTVTYFREKYYSTRIKTNDRLREIIAKKKFIYAEKLKNVQDKEWAKNVAKEIKRIKKTGTANIYYMDMT